MDVIPVRGCCDKPCFMSRLAMAPGLCVCMNVTGVTQAFSLFFTYVSHYSICHV